MDRKNEYIQHSSQSTEERSKIEDKANSGCIIRINVRKPYKERSNTPAKENSNNGKRKRHLTEEKKQMLKERNRKKLAALTDEQREELKARNREYDRKRRANLSEEQIEIRRARKRKHRANLSEERSAMLKQQRKEKFLARPIEEQMKSKARQKERDRMRNANLTEEQLAKKRERLRIYWARRTEEEKKVLREKRKQSYAALAESRKAMLKIEKSERRILKHQQNQINLYKINLGNNLDILTMVMRSIGFKCKLQTLHDTIDNMHSDIYRALLDMFNINIAHPFFIKYLNEILKKWYERNRVDFTKDDLHLYISSCINYVFENHVEDVLTVTCSFRQLESILDINVDKPEYKRPEFIYNWPNISMCVNLPGLKMNRMIHGRNEFFLARSLNRQVDSVPIQTSTVSSESILEHLQLIAGFIGSADNYYSIKCKNRLIDAIMVLKSDIESCGSPVRIGAGYISNSSRFPYVRSIAECRSSPTDVVHLYQSSNPALVFSVEKFTPGEWDFATMERLLNESDGLINCRCELCDENLGSILSDSIDEHLAEFHGTESQWTCANCEKSFSTDDLSKCRWKHDC